MKINNFNSHDKILQYTDKIDYFLNAHKTLITTELDLTNKCNHRCPGCCGNNENNAELSKEQIDIVIDNLKSMNNKGIILSGGGEPTISPYFEYAINLIKKSGMNIGLNSHGMNLDENKCTTIAENLEYFRISLDAGSPEMYKKIHGMESKHFKKTLDNIELFAKIKHQLKSKISFGVGFLTNKLTVSDMENFVKIVKDRGADFAQFRPFTGDSLDVMEIINNLKQKYDNKTFKVVGSYQKYKEMDRINDRGYDKCHGMFFNTVISADFKVWACLHFRQSKKHFLGDLRNETLESIWGGEKIKEVYNSINCRECPILCRNDSFNKTLDKLKTNIVNSEFL